MTDSRLRVVFALLWGVAILGLGACLLKAEGFSGGSTNNPDGGGDGSSLTDSDSPVSPTNEAGGGTTDGSAPKNLLSNGDFELGCAGWIVTDNGTIAESSTAKDGAHSCKLCPGPAMQAFLLQGVDVTVPAGTEYVGEVWIRSADGMNLPTSGLQIVVNQVSGGQWASTSTLGPPLQTDWQHLAAVGKPPLDGNNVALEIKIVNGTGCVLLDSATLHTK